MRDANSPAPARESSIAPIVPAKVYAVMALTTVSTFAILMAGYQLLFPPHQMFA
jgi:hypothetical protein